MTNVGSQVSGTCGRKRKNIPVLYLQILGGCDVHVALLTRVLHGLQVFFDSYVSANQEHARSYIFKLLFLLWDKVKKKKK
jgi:hypothetical protein